MPSISVIIPVYNVERYIRRCLDSVVSQTFCDWEVICVDDGSSDGSPKILDEYAAGDARFKVFHKINEGPSVARNEAIKFAAGDYTIYLDSDDFLHPQTFEVCMYMARRDNSDLVAYTLNLAYRTATLIKHFLFIPEPKHIKFPKYIPEKIESMVTDNIFDWASEIDYPGVCPDKRWRVKHCQACRCMYRTSMIKDVHFIPGIIYEDFPWWSEVMLHIQKTTIINLPFYYYYPNMKSLILHENNLRKIESLRIAIPAAESLYKSQATESQYQKWEKNFLIPFKNKLEKKENKTKR